MEGLLAVDMARWITSEKVLKRLAQLFAQTVDGVVMEDLIATVDRIPSSAPLLSETRK